MGKRGPKPRPPRLRSLSEARTRAGSKQEFPLPESLVGRPRKPHWIASDKVASSLWDDLAGRLDEAKVLSVLDQTALELLCSTYSAWRKALEDIRKNGPIASTELGAAKANPAAGILATLGKQLQQLLSEFGLTPASRSRITPVGDSPVDELTLFLNENPGT